MIDPIVARAVSAQTHGTGPRNETPQPASGQRKRRRRRPREGPPDQPFGTTRAILGKLLLWIEGCKRWEVGAGPCSEPARRQLQLLRNHARAWR